MNYPVFTYPPTFNIRECVEQNSQLLLNSRLEACLRCLRNSSAPTRSAAPAASRRRMRLRRRSGRHSAAPSPQPRESRSKAAASQRHPPARARALRGRLRRPTWCGASSAARFSSAGVPNSAREKSRRFARACGSAPTSGKGARCVQRRPPARAARLPRPAARERGGAQRCAAQRVPAKASRGRRFRWRLSPQARDRARRALGSASAPGALNAAPLAPAGQNNAAAGGRRKTALKCPRKKRFKQGHFWPFLAIRPPGREPLNVQKGRSGAPSAPNRSLASPLYARKSLKTSRGSNFRE